MKPNLRGNLAILIIGSLPLGMNISRLHAQANSKDSGQHDSPSNGIPAGTTDHDASMPGMNMQDDPGHHAEAGAMQSMAHGHHMHMDGAHMLMTPGRPATNDDWKRADELADTLGKAIER